ncbi:MAG: prolipoprotein diacylglyceryl transferase [Anaerolineae bacterium]
MDPIAFRLGPFAIRWYGLLIVTSVLACTYIASWEAKRRGENPEHIWNALLICLVTGIIGARLYHVFTVPPSSRLSTWYYLTHPLEILALWQGGLGIYGALAGALAGFYIYTRYSKLDFLHWVDISIIGAPLAQAIGRWGNFINQELYGFPTDLPWGIYIAPQNRLPGYEAFERFHPAFLYESIWNLLVFGTLLYVTRRYGDRLLRGEVLGLYLILYPLGRFFVEMIRLDSPTIAGISIAQVIAAISVLASAGVMIYRRRVRAQTMEVRDDM